MIPQAFISNLIDRVDIGELIGSRIELKRRGNELSGICPFHADSKPSLDINPDKGVYLCRACQASGNAIGFLMEYDGLGFVEAVEALAAFAGVEVPREAGSGGGGPAASETAPLYDLMQRAAEQYVAVLHSGQGAAARAYLDGRGVNAAMLERFAIGYAPPGWDFLRKRFAGRDGELEKVGLLARNAERGTVYDRFRDRIVFPIRDGRGRVVGFGGRVLGGDGPKYLNSPETPIFHKGRELYGLHEMRARREKFDSVLLVEGYMDVVGLAAQGVNNAVAVLGTAATEQHFRTLFRNAREVVCCFDGDAPGRQAAWRAAETLLPLMEGERQVRFLFLPDGEDPDTFARAQGGDGFRAALAQQAVTLSTFLFDHVSEGLNLDLLDDQAVLKERADKLIRRVPPGAWQDLLRQRARQLAGFVPRSAARRPRTPRQQAVPRPDLALHGLRIALTDPTLAAAVDAEDLQRLGQLKVRGAAVLAEVLRLQREHADAGFAWLYGRFSGREDADWLRRAADMARVETELQDVIRRLGTVRRKLSEEELAEGGFSQLMGQLAARHRANAED